MIVTNGSHTNPSPVRTQTAQNDMPIVTFLGWYDMEINLFRVYNHVNHPPTCPFLVADMVVIWLGGAESAP